MKQNEWARKSAEGGKKSAEMRKNLKGGSTTLARVVEEYLPNGINQNATLLLQSSSTSSTTTTEKKTTTAIQPFTVDDQVWNDFLAVRKAKRAPLTETALAMIEKESELAGLTLNDALTECVTRGWQSFKAEWIKPKQQQAEMTYSRAC